MKYAALPVIIALAVSGPAAPAAAFAFSPKGGLYTAAGAMTLTKGRFTLHCRMNVAGTTDPSGVGHIDHASFSGGFCSTITATGLPWTVIATGPDQAAITRASVRASLAGACGPTNLTATITPAGAIVIASAALPPDCAIKGALMSTPAVKIVGP